MTKCKCIQLPDECAPLFIGSVVPIHSLCLLAPPLRLMSAAMWKVMLQRDVTQYGRLEEFITSISESVPGLLDYRHYVKLALGLRSRVSP